MGVAQEMTAADSDHRTGWTRSDRLNWSVFFLIELSQMLFGVRSNDVVTGNSISYTNH